MDGTAIATGALLIVSVLVVFVMVQRRNPPWLSIVLFVVWLSISLGIGRLNPAAYPLLFVVPLLAVLWLAVNRKRRRRRSAPEADEPSG